MKNIFLHWSIAALIVLLSCDIKAQCPGCVINSACLVSPAYPAMCPDDTLPSGVAGLYYDEDITFYMPEYFQVTSPITQMVHLDELKIMSVVGLPMGLSWQTNSVNNTYNPSPGNEHGCAKVCGTPVVPGIYTITIFFQVTVTPQSLGGQTTQNESTTLVLIIQPNPSGNNAFIISNPVGCVPLTTTFSPVVSSGGSPLYSYTWDFGNNQTSNVENPAPVTYNMPGTYLVSNTTTISEYVLTAVTFNVGSNTNWCGDIEEPSLFGNCTGSPDLVFELIDASSNVVYTSNEISNSNTASWSGLSIPLQNGPYTLQFWDIDNISINDNLGIFPLNFTTTGTYTFSGGGASGTFTIATQVVNIITDSDSVVVYPVPVVAPLSVFPNDSVCENDSVLLWISGGYTYQWYADTIALFNASDSSLYVHQSGNYFVQVINNYGCTVISDTMQVIFVPNPPTPTFWLMGNTLNTNLSGYDLQWYFNGVPITGATGNSLPVTTAGYYHLVATDSFGCAASSDTIYFSPSSVNSSLSSEFSINIYPNPASDRVTLEGYLPAATLAVITLHDMLGHQVRETVVSAKNNILSISLDITMLERGLYWISVRTDHAASTHPLVIR